MGPDLLILGTQKAGTAWLHQSLAMHPGIWMTPEKELHWFDDRVHGSPRPMVRGLGRGLAAMRWRRQARRRIRDHRRDPRDPGLAWHVRLLFGSDQRLAWYRSMFAPAGTRVAGESTPNYAVLPPAAIRRVHEDFPDLRLVLLVRNPVERLWSQVRMVRRLHGAEALATTAEMLTYPDARAFGDYATILDNWATVFGADRIWVAFTEDVATRPRAVIDGVTDHLGLPRHDRYPRAGRVIHHGGGSTLPAPIAADLARALVDDVEAAAARLGGPAAWWSFATCRLADGHAGDDDLALPLWTSRLWDDWIAAGGGDLRPDTMPSGRLDRLPA